VVLKCFDLLGNVVGGNLLILHGSADHELVHTIGDGLLFVLRLPDEAVLLDGEDQLGHLIEVGLFAPWLNLPNDD